MYEADNANNYIQDNSVAGWYLKITKNCLDNTAYKIVERG